MRQKSISVCHKPGKKENALQKLFDVPIELFYTDEEHSARAFMMLQKENEYKDTIIIELRKERAYLEKIIELLGGWKE